MSCRVISHHITLRHITSHLQLLLPLFVQRDADGGLPLLLRLGSGLPLGDAAALQSGGNRLGLSPVRGLSATVATKHTHTGTAVYTSQDSSIVRPGVLGWSGVACFE